MTLALPACTRSPRPSMPCARTAALVHGSCFVGFLIRTVPRAWKGRHALGEGSGSGTRRDAVAGAFRVLFEPLDPHAPNRKRAVRYLSPSACLPFQARGKVPDRPPAIAAEALPSKPGKHRIAVCKRDDALIRADRRHARKFAKARAFGSATRRLFAWRLLMRDSTAALVLATMLLLAPATTWSKDEKAATDPAEKAKPDARCEGSRAGLLGHASTRSRSTARR